MLLPAGAYLRKAGLREGRGGQRDKKQQPEEGMDLDEGVGEKEPAMGKKGNRDRRRDTHV